MLPAVKLGEVVRPHQPDEAHTGIAGPQRGKGLRGVAGAKMGLDIRDLDPRVLHHLARARQTGRHRGRSMRLERIARADHPPHPIQPETLDRLAGDMGVTLVRRIERPAKQPDHLPRGRIWKWITQRKRPPIYIRGRKKGSNAPLSIALSVR